ncbi:uncharacterized protein [Amphiura filiformis]|uniref:uncharacterized protein n=1 Tax=Amphiura filiformis TaxID=82378 RepID=UPI003B224BC6
MDKDLKTLVVCLFWLCVGSRPFPFHSELKQNQRKLHNFIDLTWSKNILKKARDWTFLMDEEHKPIVFPPEIAETAKQPDITIYSATTKHAIIIELTVPSEDNLANAYARKKCKYEDLVAECENRGWTVFYFPVEMGSRDFYNTSLNQVFSCLWSPKGEKKTNPRHCFQNSSESQLHFIY